MSERNGDRRAIFSFTLFKIDTSALRGLSRDAAVGRHVDDVLPQSGDGSVRCLPLRSTSGALLGYAFVAPSHVAERANL